MRLDHSSDGAWHARRFRPDHALAGELAVGANVHIARRGQWRSLPIVERVGATVRHAYHHVAAAAEISSLGERDGEREPGSDRAIDGISALFHHLGANFSG